MVSSAEGLLACNVYNRMLSVTDKKVRNAQYKCCFYGKENAKMGILTCIGITIFTWIFRFADQCLHASTATLNFCSNVQTMIF